MNTDEIISMLKEESAAYRRLAGHPEADAKQCVAKAEAYTLAAEIIALVAHGPKDVRGNRKD